MTLRTQGPERSSSLSKVTELEKNSFSFGTPSALGEKPVHTVYRLSLDPPKGHVQAKVLIANHIIPPTPEEETMLREGE